MVSSPKLPKGRKTVKTSAPTRRGGQFFALGHDVWERLWKCPTANRLNLIATYFVLLAGTGADHRLSKWSASACEQYLGIGKPRARRAIEELTQFRLISTTAASTPNKPQYELPALPKEADPIFLPMQIVTGFEDETPILRRVRETGDPLVLRMLIDLYGLVQLDATFGVPIERLRQFKDDAGAKKQFEKGVFAVWALELGNTLNGQGDWRNYHKDPVDFWERVKILQKIGACWFEPWVFDGENLDAEPMFPVDLSVNYISGMGDEIKQLTYSIAAAAEALAGENPYLLEKHSADIDLPLSSHHQAPALRGVCRMRVEADTPGRRFAYGRRMEAVKQRKAFYDQIAFNAEAGVFNIVKLGAKKPASELAEA